MRPAAPLAGVVVPVYNAAAFLPACLQSIAAQSMQDFRCYLIDDGSADESGALCDSASAADARFCVLHQAQCGVAAARAAATPHWAWCSTQNRASAAEAESHRAPDSSAEPSSIR